MDAEIVTIGDELITGHTVDTNAAFIAEKLMSIGVRVRFRTSVGDSVGDMLEVFRLALRRVPVVITTGGLGPTDDDLTKRAIVKLFRRHLVFHEEVLEDIRARYTARGIDMPAINQNQALLPQGARLFPNRIGSALGICIDEDEHVFISLPGVPVEARQITVDSVVPYLAQLKKGGAVRVTKVRTTGIIESKLAEMIAPGLQLRAGVKLAYLPSYSGVDLRIIAEGATQEEADTRAQELVRFLESVSGKYIYGHDDESLEAVVGRLLKDNDRTLAVAESCTSGMLGMIVTSVPGSSAYFLGGIIAYANEVKEARLAVEPEIITNYGAVSEECAGAMATGCRSLFSSDFALAVTGIAGPDGGTDDKPVGTTFIALASAHGLRVKRFSFGPEREVNRSRAVYAALELLRREILDIV
jgi:nicotinamide-nucleotide amidase